MGQVKSPSCSWVSALLSSSRDCKNRVHSICVWVQYCTTNNKVSKSVWMLRTSLIDRGGNVRFNGARKRLVYFLSFDIDSPSSFTSISATTFSKLNIHTISAAIAPKTQPLHKVKADKKKWMNYLCGVNSIWNQVVCKRCYNCCNDHWTQRRKDRHLQQTFVDSKGLHGAGVKARHQSKIKADNLVRRDLGISIEWS